MLVFARTCAVLALAISPLALAAVDTVDVIANRPLAYEKNFEGKAVPAEVTVRRSGGTGALVVTVALLNVEDDDGAANDGDTTFNDFTLTGATQALTYNATNAQWECTITIPAGATSAKLVLMPIDDSQVEGAHQVIFRTVPSSTYVIGGRPFDTVTIADDDKKARLFLPDPSITERYAGFLEESYRTFGDSNYSQAVFRILFQDLDSIGNGTADLATLADDIHSFPDGHSRTLSIQVDSQATMPSDFWLSYIVLHPHPDQDITGLRDARDLQWNGKLTADLSEGDNSVPTQGVSLVGNSRMRSGDIIQFEDHDELYAVEGFTYDIYEVDALGVVWGRWTPQAGDEDVTANGVQVGTNGVEDVHTTLRLPNGYYAGTTSSLAGGYTPRTVAVFPRMSFSPGLKQDVAEGQHFSNVIRAEPMGMPDTQAFTFNIRIPAGYRGIEFLLTPRHDLVAEGAEAVTVRFLESPDFAIEEPNSATFKIGDDDCQVDIQLVNNASEPDLIGYAKVVLSEPLPVDVDIYYDVTDAEDFVASPASYTDTGNGVNWARSGAAAGTYVDYIALPGSIRVEAGSTEVLIPIVPTADQPSGQTEGAEAVGLRLLSSLDFLLAGADEGRIDPDVHINISDSLGTITLTDEDNDLTTIGSTTEPWQDGDVATPRSFTVSLSTTEAISVPFTIAGSANPGVDYILTAATASQLTVDYNAKTGTIQIPGGATTSVTISMTPKNDAAAESAESVIITLVQAPGFSFSQADPTVEFSILDNEPAISIEPAIVSASLLEGDEGDMFRVYYAGASPLDQDILIPIALGGTATVTTDYVVLQSDATVPAGNVQIRAGQFETYIRIRAVADTATDGGETVSVTLSSSSTRYSIGTATASVTILEVKKANVVSELPAGDVDAGGDFTATVTATSADIAAITQFQASITTATGATPPPSWFTVNGLVAKTINTTTGMVTFGIRVQPPAQTGATHVRARILIEYDINNDGIFGDTTASQDVTLYVVPAPSGSG